MTRRSTSYYLMAGSVLVGSLALSLPASASGLRQSHSSRASRPHAVAFSIALEDQILAYLRYLPVSFQAQTTQHTPPPTTTTSTTTTTTTTTPGSTTTTSSPPSTTATSSTTTSTTTTTLAPGRTKKAPRVNPTVLRRGRYVWRFPALPGAFKSQWRAGTNNVILRGALMHFQSLHNLPANGSMDGTTWRALVAAALAHRYNPMAYNVVYVNKALPQKLTLYQNGKAIFTSPVNTGISVAPTANGTFPVYLRYSSTTMSGTLPDGKPYHDTGIPWTSYFNGGDALHGFIRSSYGWPQSLGCVEMPFADAKVVWERTPIGTLVTVQ